MQRPYQTFTISEENRKKMHLPLNGVFKPIGEGKVSLDMVYLWDVWCVCGGLVGGIWGDGGGVIPPTGGQGVLFQKRGAQLLAKIFPGKFNFFKGSPSIFPLRITLSKPIFIGRPKYPKRYYMPKKFFPEIFRFFTGRPCPTISLPMPLLFNITILIYMPITAITAHRKVFAIFFRVTTEFYPIYERILNECPAVPDNRLKSTYMLSTIGYAVNHCFPPSTPRTDETQSAKSFVPVLQ